MVVYAQQPTEEWVARYSGPSNDFKGPFFSLDKFGNSYVAGTHVINDSNNILVVKYNTLGVQQWATLYKYPGEGYFQPMGLALDTFGNAYVTAKYGQDALSYFNSLTVKFSVSNGSVIWAKKYIGGPRHNIPEDIKIDRQNNIYVVGGSDSALLCIKYDINGDSVWVRKFQPPGFSYANACTLDDSLNIIMTGVRTQCVSFPPPGGCFDTVLTVKYFSNGTLRWAKTYFYPGNPSFNYGIKVTNDQNGNIFIGGRTRPNIGSYYYLTLKYDRNGTFQWASIYIGPNGGDSFLRGIFFDRLHNSFFVTGYSRGSQALSDYITIKYNTAAGDSAWVRRYSGISNFINVTSDIKADTSGGAYVTGSITQPGVGANVVTVKYLPQGTVGWSIAYNGPSNSDDGGVALALDNLSNVYVCGNSQGDYIVIKYSQFSGIQVINNETPREFELSQNYPNPFNPVTKIKFAIPKKSYIQLKVFDALGRVKEELINKELSAAVYEISIDGSQYSSSIYFYQLSANGQIIDTKKMVIIK